jgi:hypothetical protein
MGAGRELPVTNVFDNSKITCNYGQLRKENFVGVH